MTDRAGRRLPAVFVSHGAPSLLLEGGPAYEFLAGLGDQLGKELGRPKAILCVSAHWETDAPRVSAADRPETIHDFYGFPRPLYDMRYPAPGSPELAKRVKRLLDAAGLGCAVDPARGLDHGAWAPLKLMYPAAEIPALQLSVQTARGPRHHVELGRALGPLRDENVLVLGSGSAIHNLGELGRSDRPALWAQSFADWLDRAVAQGDAESLIQYRQKAPDGVRAHPTDEHLLPLFVALGAGGETAGKRVHSSFSHGNLGMQAYAWA